MYTNSSRSYLKMASGTPRRTNGTPWRTGGTPTAEYSHTFHKLWREKRKEWKIRFDILKRHGSELEKKYYSD